MTSEATRKGELSTRITALNSRQRALLATRIDAAVSGSAMLGKSGLVAYVLKRTAADIAVQAIRDHCAEQLPAHMLPQRFVVVDKFPRMPNGKLDRAGLRCLAVEQDEDLDESRGVVEAPRSQSEEILAGIWAEVLGTEDIGVNENFFELGGDSLLSIRILARAGKAGLKISPEMFFEHPTIAGQAGIASIAATTQAETGVVTGQFDLLPIQCWFFERIAVAQHHWNQSVLLTVRQPLVFSELQRIVHKLLLHHDALRSSFNNSAEGWKGEISDLRGELPVQVESLPELSDEERHARVWEVATRVNAGLQVNAGSLIRFVLFEHGPDASASLLIVAHHLIIDAESWRILLEDFDSLFQQAQKGDQLHLPGKTSSIPAWVRSVKDYASTASSDVDYWRARQDLRAKTIPCDFANAEHENIEANTAVQTCSLTEDEMRPLLQAASATLRCTVSELLISAVVRAIGLWTKDRYVAIDLEGHGREDLGSGVDVSRTVGWFTTVYPLIARTSRGGSVPDSAVGSLHETKEQLRTMPKHGLSFGALREFSTDPSIREVLRGEAFWPEILFNYMGQVDNEPGNQCLSVDDARFASPRSADANRAYLIEINAQLSGSCMTMEWRYCDRTHAADTIAALTESVLKALRDLAAENAQDIPPSLQLADFPLSGLDATEFANLSGMLEDLDDDEH